MSMNRDAIKQFYVAIGVVVMLLLTQGVFTVHQVEQALVVRLGKPNRVLQEPGLHFKLPFFIEEVHIFDRRLLVFEQDPQEVLSSDKKNLKVDNYAQWKIVDPLKFYQTVRNELGGISRLNDIIYSNLREVLGQYTMMEIVAGSRSDLVDIMRNEANKQSNQYGIEIVDIRIKRTDLPQENSKAVFRRMQTERERQAKQYRAQGEEEAVKIRARADKDRAVLLAESYKAAQQLRGEGDAEATSIYANAYNLDTQFYGFTRTLEAYKTALASGTTLVLEPNGFFRYLQGLDPGVR
ncbi:MAG: protease modulator HflC [Magnetococcus sp. DMHC-6]